MTYYDTLDEDIKRAKEILEKGKMRPEDAKELPVSVREAFIKSSGTIYGADTTAAYKLLESFVEWMGQAQQDLVQLREQNHRLIKEREQLRAAQRREDHHVAEENPFDHNAECTYCDEQAAHRADCPWLLELLRENKRLRERDKTATNFMREVAFAVAQTEDWHGSIADLRDLLSKHFETTERFIEQLTDMLLKVEWVRQSAGNKYACPFCGGISERDGGPGHMEGCDWVAVTYRPSTPVAPQSASSDDPAVAAATDSAASAPPEPTLDPRRV